MGGILEFFCLDGDGEFTLCNLSQKWGVFDYVSYFDLKPAKMYGVYMDGGRRGLMSYT